MPDATCATCPWYDRGNEYGGLCHRGPAASVGMGRTDMQHETSYLHSEGVCDWPWVPTEGWCGEHPLRAPRVCLVCAGTGIKVFRQVGNVPVAEYCPHCHGTGRVVPEVGRA